MRSAVDMLLSEESLDCELGDEPGLPEELLEGSPGKELLGWLPNELSDGAGCALRAAKAPGARGAAPGAAPGPTGARAAVARWVNTAVGTIKERIKSSDRRVFMRVLGLIPIYNPLFDKK
jgi:hypothetical protein